MAHWDRILREEIYSSEEPDEFIKKFISSLKNRKTLRVLDLGCGAGRHVVYAAKHGLKVCGVDFSATGLDMTRGRLRKAGLKASLLKCDLRILPFVGSCFDAVICTRAIYHQRFRQILVTVSEVNRILGKEGLLVVDFLSKRTSSYGQGMAIERDTFVEQEGTEKGVIHHFVDEDELKRIFRNYRFISLELCEREIERKLRSRWIVTAMV